ncbi:MAG: polysaccharide biosynthesis/export family protein [Pseudomonadota bacterium]
MRVFFLALWAVLLAGVALAQSDYVVRSGDTLRIEVLEDASLNRSVIVLPDGRFSFPFAGTVRAGGRTLSQIETSIGNAIASNFAAPPNVFVAIQQLRPTPAPTAVEIARANAAARRGLLPETGPTISVFLLGEVNTPGPQDVPPGTTFLQALSRSGGFSNFAALKRIQVRRTDASTGAQSLFVINYRDLSRGSELTGNIALQEGDVILVPQRRLFE